MPAAYVCASIDHEQFQRERVHIRVSVCVACGSYRNDEQEHQHSLSFDIKLAVELAHDVCNQVHVHTERLLRR